MQIILDISEEDYLSIKDGHMPFNVLDSIRNAVPLPKGHGRLGDLGEIYIKLNNAQVEGTPEYKGLGEAKQIVCDALTIIVADAEGSEEG